MKVILVQLPVPDNRFTNLPLALGYLKAMAEAANLPGVQVELLQAPAQNRAGDALLVDTILAHDPDLVGFSLYTWNSSRTLSLARDLKRLAPEVLLVGGGPEVNYDGDWILNSPDFDFLVQGEGERTFVELLQTLNQHHHKHGFSTRSHKQIELSRQLALGIRGLGVRTPSEKGLTLLGAETSRVGDWQFGMARAALENVNLVPSAYLDGALEGHLGRFMSIELSRWCPSKCTFCYYGRQDLPRGGQRYFELARIRQELLFGMAHGVEQIHFVEANFNSLPHLGDLYALIKEVGANRQMSFYAELRGEAITTEQAQLLADCNFSTVEVGLQSAVPEVMAKVQRKNNLPRLVQGVQNLREKGIEVFLDVILGLPGETPETFQRTLAFMAEHQLDPYDMFHLQILPGTTLKAEMLAGQHGIKAQSGPPYFVLETADLPFEKLVELRRGVLTSKGLDPTLVAGRPTPGAFALSEISANHLDQSSQIASTGIVERVMADLTSDTRVDMAAVSSVARQLGSEVTVWLKLGEVGTSNIDRAKELLQTLSLPNPTGIWHLFVQTDRPLTAAEQRQLTSAIHHAEGYIDRLAVFAQAEQSELLRSRWPSITCFNVLPYAPHWTAQADSETVWQIHLSEDQTLAEWEGILKEAVAAPGAGIYLVSEDQLFSRPMLARWKTLLAACDLGQKRLWLGNWSLAAGLTASQADDSTDMLTSLDYPLTVRLDNNALYPLQPSQPQLEKAALSYQLSRG